MSFLYDQIYEDVKNLIKKYDSRDPREILIQRGVNIIAFKENTKLLGMYKIIKRNSFVFIIPLLIKEFKIWFLPMNWAMISIIGTWQKMKT